MLPFYHNFKNGLVLVVGGQWWFTLQWTSDTEHLTNFFKILQCPSTGAMIDQVPHREQCQCVKELEDGIARLVDRHDNDTVRCP